MAASVVQGKGLSASSTTSIQLTLDAPVAPGSVVAVQLLLSATSRTAALSDNSASGQTWQDVGTMPQNPSGSTSLRQYVWRCLASEAFDQLTATISGGTVSAIHLLAIEMDGLDETPSVVAQEAYRETYGPIASDGLTTLAADQFLLACVGKDSGSDAWKASSGWTQAVATSRGQILTRDAPTAGAYSCSIDWSSAADRDVTVVFAAFPVTGDGDPPDPPDAAGGTFIGGLF